MWHQATVEDLSPEGENLSLLGAGLPWVHLLVLPQRLPQRAPWDSLMCFSIPSSLLYCGRHGSVSFPKSLLGLLPVPCFYSSEGPGDSLASTFSLGLRFRFQLS